MIGRLLRRLRIVVGASAIVVLISGGTLAQETLHPDSTPPLPAPTASGLVKLFDGTRASLDSNWRQGGKRPEWTVDPDGMTAVRGDIATVDQYTDFQLHVEFRVPYMPDKKGQSRGNSGVFLQGRYEIQVLDSYGIHEPGSGDCGAIYSQYAPLVNACRAPLQWQTYDISFRAPRFDANTHTMMEPARVTVLQNGLIVQNAQIINGPTHIVKPKKDANGVVIPPPVEDLSIPGPIRLQFHGNTVAYRNIWIVPLPLQPITRYAPK